MPNPDKKIIVIAGPNGAGKTTFAKTFLPQEARIHFTLLMPILSRLV